MNPYPSVITEAELMGQIKIEPAALARSLHNNSIEELDELIGYAKFIRDIKVKAEKCKGKEMSN